MKQSSVIDTSLPYEIFLNIIPFSARQNFQDVIVRFH